MPQRVPLVRPLKGSEAEKILNFYRAADCEGVLPRPLKDLQESAEKGLFFVAEMDATLIAVGGVFDLGQIPYVELGGDCVDKPLRGFRIQCLFYRLRIASVILNEGPGAPGLAAFARPGNRRVHSSQTFPFYLIRLDPCRMLCTASMARVTCISSRSVASYSQVSQKQRDLGHPARELIGVRLCPIRFHLPLGLLVVMTKADPLPQERVNKNWDFITGGFVSLDEMQAASILMGKNADTAKPDTYGLVDGRLVVVDYGWWVPKRKNP